MRKYPHTLTWWDQSGTYTASGDEAYATPVQVKGRWEERCETFLDEKGEEAVSRAVCYLQEQDVSVGDWLMLGTSSTASPVAVSGAYRVRGWAKVPSVDGSKYERKAWM